MLMDGGTISAYLDYTTWADGQTGSATGFSQNGSTAENSRITGPDPWGRKTVLWEATPDGLTYGADGGWNSYPYVAIDNTKTYRLSVWVNRTVMGTLGGFYFGWRNGTSTTAYSSNAYRLFDGTTTNNPYFFTTSSPPGSQLPEGTWMLLVGHIRPYTWTGTTNHEDTGRWTIDGIYSSSSIYDWRFGSDCTHLCHRSYLYYADTDTTPRQRWCYPRIDLVDGTELPIEALLSGTSDDPRYNGISEKKFIYAPSFSEVGPSPSNIVAQWKFDGNSTDYGPYDLQATTNGSPSFGAGLNGWQSVTLASGDYYTFGTAVDPYVNFGATDDFSVCGWLKSTDTVTHNRILFNDGLSNAGWNFFVLNTGYGRLKVHDGVNDDNVDTAAGGLLDGEWHFLLATRDASGNLLTIYVDGAYSNQVADTTGDLTTSNKFAIGYNIVGSEGQFTGTLQDLRIYNKVLTAEEVNILYKTMIDVSTTGMQLSSDCCYASKEFEETM